MTKMHWVLVVICVAGFWIGGCSKVLMTAEYAGLLDQTCAWADDRAVRADANALTYDELKRDQRTHRELWFRFRCARDGQEKP